MWKGISASVGPHVMCHDISPSLQKTPIALSLPRGDAETLMAIPDDNQDMLRYLADINQIAVDLWYYSCLQDVNILDIQCL